MDEENKAQVNAQESVVLRHQPRRNYSTKFQVPGGEIDCYTKKQMRSLYPKADFVKAAEYAPGSKKEKTGELHYSSKSIPLAGYGSHSRIAYKEKGFVAVDLKQDGFVVLLKKALLPRTALLAGCIALIILAAFFAPQLWTGGTEQIADEAISEGMPELDENAVDWEGVQPHETGGTAAGIAIPGFKSITIDADSTDAYVNLYNPQGNPCYFVISLVLDDGMVLYQSKMIEPGKALYGITLSRPLAAGEYEAMIMYETYSLDALKPMNGANVKFTLIAK